MRWTLFVGIRRLARTNYRPAVALRRCGAAFATSSTLPQAAATPAPATAGSESMRPTLAATRRSACESHAHLFRQPGTQICFKIICEKFENVEHISGFLRESVNNSESS